MKTPPVPLSPGGADKLLPTVAERSAASHQVGCAKRVKVPSCWVSRAVALLLVAYRLTATEATPSPTSLKYAVGSEVALQ